MSLFPNVEHFYDPDHLCFSPDLNDDDLTIPQDFLPRLKDLGVTMEAFFPGVLKAPACESFRQLLLLREAHESTIPRVYGVYQGPLTEKIKDAFTNLTRIAHTVSPRTRVAAISSE